MRKIALLVGVSNYGEELEALPSAVKDVAAMQQVLVNPEMGGFADADVTVLPNPDRQAMSDAIYTLFANRQKDDLALLYFSGHGILDDANEFYFSTHITRKVQNKLVPTTALPAKDIQGWMERSKSERKVLILDSCFSGAFAKGVKAKDSGSVNPEQFLGGKGTAILTASTSTQYALTQEGFDLSLYTHYLVEGIRTGGADRDNDGMISVEELHAYAKEKVQSAAPAMTPEFYPFRDGGHRIVLSRSPTDDPRLRYRKEVEKRVYQGMFTIPARRVLNSLQKTLPLDAAIAAEIEAEVLKPYQEFQRKLQDYEETLIEIMQEGDLSDRVFSDLQDYQTHLGLRDEDIRWSMSDRLLAPNQADYERQLERLRQERERLEQKRLEQESQQAIARQQEAEQKRQQQAKQPPPVPTFEFNVVTVNAKGKEQQRDRRRAEYLTENLGNNITLDMVAIPGGQFQMGSNEYESEKPIHAVTIAPFYLGKYAITQAQYKAVMGNNPSNFKGAKRPVEQVSWDEAIAFCTQLSQKTGKTYRLPTEAEWEYACRAGTTTPFYFGETIATDLANYDGDQTYGEGVQGEYRQQTTDVGTFPANAFGLYDMHGNVRAWCADQWYRSYANKPDKLKQDGAIAWTQETTGMAPNADETDRRVLRGGSWYTGPVCCRSAYRSWNWRDYRNELIGFRLVLSAPRTL